MRTREEINNAPSFPEAKILEVLLDIRELLGKQVKRERARNKREKRNEKG